MTGGELAERRRALGLSQKALADTLGVDVMTVSRWERGVRAIPTHLALALESLERNAR